MQHCGKESDFLPDEKVLILLINSGKKFNFGGGIKMLVFSTRLPLKDKITSENCLQLFKEWVEQSPHYSIDEINYDVYSHEDFECSNGKIFFSIRHFENNQIKLSACRLENHDSNAVWINDCIYIVENGEKSLLIQLNCNRTDFSTQLPRVHKPYIVRKFIEMSFCKNDADIPLTDTPLDADGAFYDICVKIMQGTYRYSMPVVYISCDYWGKHVLSPQYLAKQLSGVAHVFVEQNHETALKLRDATDGNNAYTGYIGIYFPGTKFCQRHGLEYYRDYREMTQEIISSVWSALVNRLDSSVYNWNQIITLQSRQKMLEWQDISAQDKEQLSEYMDTFDQENTSLREKIDELNQQVYSLRSQLDVLRATLRGDSENSCFYKVGKESSLYVSEKEDLLYSILSQAQKKYPQNSRGYIIIQSLLEANPRHGECKKIISKIRSIFNNGPKLTKAMKAQLKDVGFSIEEDGSHFKLTFHDSRYMFSVSKTPSDHREGKNLISDICNIIDIERKI
ncbi:MAG: hypothetical protein HFG27_13640 [Provencibacterium sp.]|jgi:hypothetical protein|nr:hypothetical protein [Provencibacterium sp.]